MTINPSDYHSGRVPKMHRSYFKQFPDSLMLNAEFTKETIMAARKKGTFASASAALTKAMRNMEHAISSTVGTKAKTKKKTAKRKSKKSRRKV